MLQLDSVRGSESCPPIDFGFSWVEPLGFVVRVSHLCTVYTYPIFFCQKCKAWYQIWYLVNINYW